jgi:hypothetical protein
MKLFFNSKLLTIAMLLAMMTLAHAELSVNDAAHGSMVNLKSVCPLVQSNLPNRPSVFFFQYQFEDGTQDLAMAIPSEGGAFDIKRVGFGGAKESKCHYQSMALTRGGDWGWHLAWVVEGSAVLSYARMDGEAWVSSPTKKLSKNVHLAGQPAILTWEQQVWIVWQGAGEKDGSLFAVFSADEGRTWQETKLISKNSGNSGKLQLITKENKPHLIWDGATEAVPLLAW